MANPDALITLIVYAVILVGIGFWASQKAKSEDSFILADRNLGPVIAGLAYAASTSSAWVLLGFSGFVYAAGLSAFWMVPGILAGYGVVWFWAGKVLQDETRGTQPSDPHGFHNAWRKPAYGPLDPRCLVSDDCVLLFVVHCSSVAGGQGKPLTTCSEAALQSALYWAQS